MTNAEQPIPEPVSSGCLTDSGKIGDCPPPPGPPTEPQIIACLIRQDLGWGHKGTVMPHYTPTGWWECDLAYFTQAGYLTEFEVKVSLADFKKDAKKSRFSRYRRWQQSGGGQDIPHEKTVEELELEKQIRQRQTKHQQIEAGRGPKHFWFCAPSGVIPLGMVPEWAGLMEFSWSQRRSWRSQEFECWELTRTKTKKAPSLKGRKYGREVIDHCRGVAYYRLLANLAKTF